MLPRTKSSSLLGWIPENGEIDIKTQIEAYFLAVIDELSR
jgi:hypothetical protein